jgi:hypothetical protein
MKLPARVLEVFSPRDDAPLNFEAMWREAQSFRPTKVEIESPVFFGTETKVMIRFKRPSGSSVDATGLDHDVLVAFDKALREARLLAAR